MDALPTLPVTLRITRRVDATHYADLVNWTERGESLAGTFAGYLGARVFAPPPGCDA